MLPLATRMDPPSILCLHHEFDSRPDRYSFPRYSRVYPSARSRARRQKEGNTDPERGNFSQQQMKDPHPHPHHWDKLSVRLYMNLRDPALLCSWPQHHLAPRLLPRVSWKPFFAFFFFFLALLLGLTHRRLCPFLSQT